MALQFALATAGVGVAAGLAGVLTGLLLRAVQYLVYGDGSGDAFVGLPADDPLMRIGLLAAAGLVVGTGWWLLHRAGRSPVSISDAVRGARMPGWSMVTHVVLQLVSVGSGASIGREVAPRELGALSATWTEKAAPGLTARQRRLLIAAGAGAGLASAYQVPFAGALFAVEVLLAEFSLGAILVAATVSAFAELVSVLLAPAGPVYALPPVAFSPSLLVWAVVAGPVAGILATGFSRLAHRAAARRPRSWRLLITLPVAFAALGAVSLPLPEVLGNGQSLVAPAFLAQLSMSLAILLFFVKGIATISMIGAGAYGGTLTPSLSLGALFGLVTGGLWTALWPGSSLPAFALCGAAAFLAGSMAAPLTALALTIELAGGGFAVLLPMVLAVALSTAARWLFDTRARRARLSVRRLEHTEPAAEDSVQT